MEHVCTITDVPSVLEPDELVSEQSKDDQISNAIKYFKQNKKDFDVSKLGELKRFRKKLRMNKNGLLTWNDKIVVPLSLRKKLHYLKI